MANAHVCFCANPDCSIFGCGALRAGGTYGGSVANWTVLYPTPDVQVSTPHRCPVCNGTGERDRWQKRGVLDYVTPCHACGGKGIVWSNQ